MIHFFNKKSCLATYPVPLQPLIYVFTQNHKTAEYEHVNYKQPLKILDSETILEKNEKKKLKKGGWDFMKSITDILYSTANSFHTFASFRSQYEKYYFCMTVTIFFLSW